MPSRTATCRARWRRFSHRIRRPVRPRKREAWRARARRVRRPAHHTNENRVGQCEALLLPRVQGESALKNCCTILLKNLSDGQTPLKRALKSALQRDVV
jgi:hypothetical protein